jgi:hypothetical protein
VRGDHPIASPHEKPISQVGGSLLGTGALLLAGTSCAPAFNLQQCSVNLGPVVNTGFDDQHRATSRDGLSLYFSSNRPDGFELFSSGWRLRESGDYSVYSIKDGRNKRNTKNQ